MTKSKKERSRKYYKSVIKDHQEILAHMRFLIKYSLEGMVEYVKNSEAEKAQNQPGIDPKMTQNNMGDQYQRVENFQYFYNKKISPYFDKDSQKTSTSIPEVMAKLGRIAMKMIPLEQELAKLDLNKKDLKELHNRVKPLEPLPEEDKEIIDMYVEMWIRDKGWEIVSNNPKCPYPPVQFPEHLNPDKDVSIVEPES